MQPYIVDISEDHQGTGFSASQRKLVRTTNGIILATYRKKSPPSSGIYQPFVARSTNNGASWNIIQVANITTDHQRVPSIALASDGKLHLVWYGKDPSNTGTNQRQIKYSNSTDNGVSWSTWQSVGGDVPGYVDQANWQEHPKIIVHPTNPNKLFCVWEGHDSTNTTTRPCKFSKSTDAGATWSSWTNIGVTGNTQSRPDIAITSDGKIHVVAYSSVSGTQQIIHNISSDEGTTWSGWNTVGLSGQDSRHCCIYPHGTELDLVFRSRNATKSPNKTQIHYSRYTGTWSSPIVISARPSVNQYFPQLSRIGNYLAVVWQETPNDSGYTSESPTDGIIAVSIKPNNAPFIPATSQTSRNVELFPNLEEGTSPGLLYTSYTPPSSHVIYYKPLLLSHAKIRDVINLKTVKPIKMHKERQSI